MSFAAQTKKPERSSNPRSGAYLLSRHGTLYFRIVVPNHLQSLLNKREIRRSLGTSKIREARAKAMRLAVVAQDYFFLAEQCLMNKVHSLPKDHLQQFEIALDNLKSSGTFLLDKALDLGNLNAQPTMIPSTPERQDSAKKSPMNATTLSTGCVAIKPNKPLQGAINLIEADSRNSLRPTANFRDLDIFIGTLKPDIVFVDTFARFAPCNENDNQAVTMICGLLEELAAKWNCNVIVLHHTNKASGAFANSKEELR